MQKQFELQQKLIEEKQKLALLAKQREIERLRKEQDRQLFEGIRLEDSNPSRSVINVRAMTVSPEHDSPSPLDSPGHDSPPAPSQVKNRFCTTVATSRTHTPACDAETVLLNLPAVPSHVLGQPQPQSVIGNTHTHTLCRPRGPCLLLYHFP